MANSNGSMYLTHSWCAHCHKWRPKCDTLYKCPVCKKHLRLGNRCWKNKSKIRISGITGKVAEEVSA